MSRRNLRSLIGEYFPAACSSAKSVKVEFGGKVKVDLLASLLSSQAPVKGVPAREDEDRVDELGK